MAETTKPGCLAQALIGLAFAYIFAIVRQFLKYGELEPASCLGLLVLIAILLVVASIGGRMAQRTAEDVTRRRTERAIQIFAMIQSGTKPPPFNFYLRPFESTGRLLISNADHIFGSGLSKGTAPELLELETVLANVLATWEIEFVALGRPGEHVGAGRVETADVGWEDKMKLLVRHANVIYMIPSANEGTFTELQFLTEADLLQRCIFIMPPFSPRSSESPFEAQTPDKWSSARERASSIGVELPAFDPEGALFVLDERGKLKDQRPIGASTTIARLSESLSDLAWKLGRSKPSPANS